MGREKVGADSLTCTSPRKISPRFGGYKYTSLVLGLSVSLMAREQDHSCCVDGSLIRKSLRVFPAIHSLGAFQKMSTWHICAALLRSLHCYGLVLAKGWEESPYQQCCQPETKHKPTHTRK